ncbi:MAG TPA: hypothetical protein VFK02_34025 [Kofleriaceae bacterium]|nr:hypothetical protein [Kofleriaceae bacterium]
MQRFDLPLVDPHAAAALASAARHARRYLVSRRMFCASVTHHDVAAETYDRVLYSIEHRQLIVRQTPGGNGPLRPPPTSAGLDPWAMNPDTIEDDTRAVAACPSCHGGGDLACPICKGSTWARCPHCIGGKVLAQQKGRLFKNCPYCRGRGTQKCTNCLGGRIDCSQCNASGRVTAWLALDRRFRFTVTVHPRNAAARIHRQIDNPQDFDSRPWSTRLSADTGLQRSLNVPSELQPVIDPRSERVISGRQQTFCTDVHKFTFATLVGTGRVEVAGEPPVVAPTSRWGGLRTRLVLSSALAVLGILGVASLHNDYVARNVWYARYGDGAPLIGFGVGASFLLAVALAFLLVARSARSWFAVGMAAGAAAAFALGVFLAYTHEQPTATAARRELVAGNLQRARDEAQALIDTHRDPAGGGEVLDELHLRRAKGVQSLPELISCLAEPWHADEARANAEAVLRARVQQRASELYANHDARELDLLDGEIHAARPELSDGVQWLLATVRAGAFLEVVDTTAASVQLAIVIKLADRVPLAMRPADAQLITTTATTLAPVLAAVHATPVKDRVKALAAALEPAREYARLVGMDADVVVRGLVKQQNELVRTLERAARLAQQQRAERERQAQSVQQQAEPIAGMPVDPYSVRTEPTDVDATQQRDPQQ